MGIGGRRRGDEDQERKRGEGREEGRNEGERGMQWRGEGAWITSKEKDSRRRWLTNKERARREKN